METFTLTELQYSQDRKGPFALYIFDSTGYHSGRQYFASKIKRADAAIAKGKEVRITDGGDMLVFHSRGGKVLFGEKFWEEIAA